MAINNAESIPATRPPGRPPGSRNHRTVFVEALFTEDAEKVRAIVETAIRKAIDGDADFAKLVLARIAPEPKGRLVQFDLPPLKNLRDISEAIAAVAQAIADGKLTIEEGEKMASLLNKYAQPVIEEAELERRILALEDERR
jgi:hypothetical protein